MIVILGALGALGPPGAFIVEGGANPGDGPGEANFESTFCKVFWMSVSF